MNQLEGYPRRAETLALQSIVVALQENGVNISDIKRLLCSCCDLEKVGDYLNTPDIMDFVSKFDLKLYGNGKIPQNIARLNRVTWYPVKARMTEHTTIIEMKNRPALVWFEPHHDLRTGICSNIFGINVFGEGTYLVTPSAVALEKAYSKFASFEK